MGYKIFSPQQRFEIQKLIISACLSYPQIAERYGVRRDRIQSIAKSLGVTRPHGSASPFHPKHKAKKENANV